MATAPTITDPGRPRHAMELPVVGDHVGRYTVLEQIGAGAMGAVFLASDPELNRRVAIKVMAMRGGHDFRLLDEARALARLQHPNVVAIHDVGRWQGQVYIAMEHVAGQSLDVWLEDHRDWRARLGAFVQAGHGLAAAHRAKIVHHDVKPSNVMVGDDGRVRLVDFGLAKSADPENAVGSAGGTPRYMSPEQRRGEVADARTDQFSLCIALYEALFDAYPYAGATPEERDAAVLEGRVLEPPTGPVPARVRAAIVKGLSPAREDRHASIEALLGELALPAPSRRGRWLAAVAAAAIVAGVGTTVVVKRQAANARHGKWDAILAASHLPPEQPASLPDDPLHVTVHRLSNGLTVHISPNHDTPRVQAVMRFRSGMQDGLAAGLASRMSRRGTSTIGAVDFAKEKPLLDELERLYAEKAKLTDGAARAALDDKIEKVSIEASKYAIADEHTLLLQAFGTHRNDAYAYRNWSWFEADIPSNWLPMWAELEANRWSDPVFRAFRSSVIEVVNYPRNPSFYGGAVIDRVFKTLYAGHALGFDFDELARAEAAEPLGDVETYFRTYYVPNNADLLITGDVDPVTLLPMLEKAFASWHPRPLPPPVPEPVLPVIPQTITMTTPGVREVSMHWRTPYSVESDPAHGIFAKLVGNAKAHAKATGGSGWNLGFYSARLEALPGEPLEQTEKRLTAQLDEVLQGRFTDADIAGAIHEYRAEEALANLDAHARLLRMAGFSWRRRMLAWQDDVKAADVRKVTRADVLRVAHELLDQPHITIREETGTPAPKPAIAVPKAPVVAFQVGNSEAGKALLARDKTDLQPKLMVAGVDYEERDTPAGHLIARREPKLQWFLLQTRFQVGTATLPLVCEAVRARVEAMMPALRAQGVMKSLTCNHRWMTLILGGLDEDLPAAAAAMKQAFADPSADEWKRIVEIEAQAHANLGARTDWLGLALEHYAVFGPSAPYLREFDIDATKRGNAQEAAAELARLRSTDRYVSYVGPRASQDVVALLPAKESSAQPAEQGTSPLPPSSTRAVYVIDTGALTPSTYVNVIWPFKGMYARDAEVRWELFSQYWANGVDARVTGAGNYSFTTALVFPYALDDPGYVALRIQTTPERALEQLRRGLSSILEDKIDPARVATAKQERAESARTDWVKLEETGTRIIAFRVDGNPPGPDPRIELSQLAAALGPADVEKCAADLRGTAQVITIWGNTKGLDRKALAKLGEVHELTMQDLMEAHARSTGAQAAAPVVDAPAVTKAPAKKTPKRTKPAKKRARSSR